MILIVILTIASGLGQFVTCKSTTCSDDCLSTTYCLSADGSNSCSGKVRTQAKFSVVQLPGSYDRIHLLLLGHEIGSIDEISISVTMTSLRDPSKGRTSYSCYKSPFGATKASVFQKDSNSTLPFGSSYYSAGTLSCIWIFSRYDKTWPMLNEKPVLLNDDKNYQISLHYGSQVAIVAQDSSALPIYQLQFLDCCNRVFRKDKYLFTFNEEKGSINYLVHVFDPNPMATTISLRNSRGSQLFFSCLYPTVAFNAKLIDQGNETKITNQLIDKYIADSRCSWSTRLYLNCTSVTLSVPNDVFDLQIISGSVVVYAESGISLRNSGNPSVCRWSTTLIMALIGLKLMI